MAGPWEQYQQPSAAPAAASSAPDQGPWTQYQPQAQGGIGRNIVAGMEEAGTSALKMIGQVANPVFGMLEMASHPVTAPFGDRPIISPPDVGALLEPAFRKTGISPATTTATTVPEKIARGAGQGIVFGAVPVGEAPTMAKLIAQGVIGAAAGGAAYPAQEAVPESVRPVFGPAVAVLAGGAAGAGVAGAEAGARAGAEAVARSAPGKAVRTVAAGMGPENVEINIPTPEGGVTPMRTTGAAAREAGAILATRATAPQTMADMIAQGIEKPVPGSQPTTFQATGDMGIGALERDVATRNPELFLQRRAEQNVARTQALTNLQQGGDVGAVTDFLRGQLGSLDQDSQSAVEQAANAARQRVSEMGGAGTPEVYGEQLRGALNEAEAASKARERGLWQAIDPNNELTGNVSTTREAARSIVDEMPKTAKPMGSEEAAIFQAAQDMNRLSPVSDLIELRSRLRAEMSHELMTQGRSPAYARMTQLRQAIQDNLANTISDQVAAEAENVRPGETPPPESLIARLQGWLDDYIAQRQQAGTAPGTAAGGVPGPGPGAGGIAAGTEGAAGGGLGGAAGSEGVPGVAPTFDEAARQRLAAATAATRERAGTFNRGPVALALRRGELQDVFRMPEAQVPQKFFHPGPTGFDDMQALYRAVGQSRAVPMIADYAAMSLRRAAMDENGVLDPAKFNRWRASHADALRALPDEVRQRFADAASAGREVVNATEARTRALKDFQAGRVSQLLNLTEPEDISRTVGRVFSSPRSRTEMRALVDRVRGDKNAREGLRQAVADFITQRFVSNTEGAASGVNMLRADQFLQFVRTQKGALDEVFTPKQVQAIQDIASDLQRSQRSQTAVKLPGQSNTAQDLYSIVSKPGGGGGKVAHNLLTGLAGLMGLPIGGPAGALIAGFGAHLLQSMREAGIDRIDQLVTQAMLYPEVAEQLLRRAPKELMRTQTEKLAAALAPSGADEQARMQRAAPFYSAVERTVDQSKTAKASGEQWLKTLENAPGVKKEEMDWIGVPEFLRMAEGPVSREQLLDFVRQGGVKLEEKSLNESDNSTQFSDWKLPGGEDYKELLLTLPDIRGPATHWDQPNVVAHTRIDTRRDPEGHKVLFVEEVQSDWHQKGRDQGYQRAASQQELSAATDALKEARDNVLSARAELRGLAETPENMTALDETAARIHARPYSQLPANEQAYIQQMVVRQRMGREPEAQSVLHRLSQADLVAQERSQQLRNLEGGIGIPNAPFKSTWPALVMKRLIRYAVDNGFDKVAWTTGEQQAERYDLSHHVGEIYAHRQDPARDTIGVSTANMDANRALEAANGGSLIFTRDKLHEVFGRELGERIYKEGRESPYTNQAVISGEGLKLGGEGMKAFYDRNLVNITNDIIKRYGAKVGHLDLTPSDRAAVRTARPVREAGAQLGVQHSFDITPKMAEAASGGFPLFQRGGDAGARAERNVGPGLFGTPAERDATYQKLSDAVDKVVSRIAPKAKVEGYARLSDNRGPEAGGAIRGSTFARRTPDGIEHVILWSLESPDAVGTVRHEAIHALRDMGLFTDREWGALERAANERGWLDRYDIERRYPGLDHEQRLEEAVAEAFADWRADPKTPVPVGVRSIFQRLADALRGIGTAARRVLGRNVSADDVFHLIDSGRLGRRRPQYAPAFDASVRFARAAGVRRSPRLAAGLARALTRSVVASTPAGMSAHRRRAAR